jgi:hypothetical protein
MKSKLAISALLVSIALGYAFLRGYPPFSSQMVRTCERAIQERLQVPSTYQRIGVVESKRTITFDEFFTDPVRAVPEASRKAMVQVARVPPVQFAALIEYEGRDSLGGPLRTTATCTFNSLEGDDAPSRTDSVVLDGERNYAWAARQANALTLLRRLER